MGEESPPHDQSNEREIDIHMPKCERCNQNDARVRLDSVVNGRREQHFFCRQCAEELLGGDISSFGGLNGMGGFGGNGFGNAGNDFGNAGNGNPFNFGIPQGNGGSATAQRTPDKHSKTPTLDQFGRDLTAEAREGKLDPAAGREREIRRVLTVLGRRQKNNPVLIGEPGVGKTAIVEGIARRIIEGNVPANLRNARIVTLSMGGTVAGAMFRGQFEERIKQILEEVRQNPEVILFIDELHTVVGAGNAEGAVGAADLLKPALARGELRCIGATTLDEYRKNIEKDAALERRFQPIYVGEPSVEDTISILRGIKEKYELHHGVRITDGAIVAAATLANRYITDRFLPDKAIDLMDEAASRIRMEVESKPEEIENLDRRIIQLKIEREALRKETDDASKD